MEVFEMILGLVMIYAWVHSLIIFGTKVAGLTQYEKVVLIVAGVMSVLFIVGSLS